MVSRGHALVREASASQAKPIAARRCTIGKRAGPICAIATAREPCNSAIPSTIRLSPRPPFRSRPSYAHSLSISFPKRNWEREAVDGQAMAGYLKTLRRFQPGHIKEGPFGLHVVTEAVHPSNRMHLFGFNVRPRWIEKLRIDPNGHHQP